MDLETRFSFRAAVESLDRLDGYHLFSGLLASHESGVQVLAGASHADEWDRIAVPALARVINVAQSSFDYVVADIGPDVSSDWAQVLRLARQIILVTETNVSCLWSLERHITLLRALGIDSARIRLVVNRWHRGDEEALQAFEKRVKLPIFERLPNDFERVSRAVNMGAETRAVNTTNWCRGFAAWSIRLPATALVNPKKLNLSSAYFQAGDEKLDGRHYTRQPDIGKVKAQIHRRLIQRLNLDRVSELNREAVRTEVNQIVEGLVASESMPMTLQERERLSLEILDEVFGLGPLEPLLKDPNISDILVNTYKDVYIERKGLLERTNVQFRDESHLKAIIDRIVSAVGRRIDESSPMVDARLADGSRVNAIIPPLAIDGSCLSIRRFGREPLDVDALLRNQSLTSGMLAFLRGSVFARMNIIISGGTGAGKTTLLNVLSSFISNRERIVTIEDAAELQLHQDHVVRLETRPPNVEGKGAVLQRQLVINTLRMRPDRIIVGEVRGEEALDMLQAMNTGHDGSLTTIHANSTRDALGRLETMVAMASLSLPEIATRRQIASAIDLVIQVSRLSDGSRKVTSIAEITGVEGDIISMQEIFTFRKTGLAENGTVLGKFARNGNSSPAHGAPGGIGCRLTAFHVRFTRHH